ncbi:hypothetical protein BT69DRAFT_1399844, partial [Atractiella rhizophila]
IHRIDPRRAVDPRGLSSRTETEGQRFQEQDKSLITSGSIFVFEEAESAIRRWRDGLVWSPSRVLENFLVYRELEKCTIDHSIGQPAQEGFGGYVSDLQVDYGQKERGGQKWDNIVRRGKRSFVDSPTWPYRFKREGLVKKTISMSGMHLISYYKMNDVLTGRLHSPTSQPELRSLDISPSLLVNQNFRVPPHIEIGPGGQARYRGGDSDVGVAIRTSNRSVVAITDTPLGENNMNGAGGEYATPTRARKRRGAVEMPETAGPSAVTTTVIGEGGIYSGRGEMRMKTLAESARRLGAGRVNGGRRTSQSRYCPYSTVSTGLYSSPTREIENHTQGTRYGNGDGDHHLYLDCQELRDNGKAVCSRRLFY